MPASPIRVFQLPTGVARSLVARTMVAAVLDSQRRHGGDAAAVEAECAAFKAEFPQLYRVLTARRGEYPPEVLEAMLRALERVEDGRASEHDAAVAVGTILVDRYVRPMLEAMPPPAAAAAASAAAAAAAAAVAEAPQHEG